jgi:hypothetical protein
MWQKAVARRLDIPVTAVEKHMIKAIAHLSVSLGNNRLLESTAIAHPGIHLAV